jgi:hypothetical protein
VHCLSRPEIAAAIEEAHLTVAPRKLVEAAGLGAP